MKLSRIETKDFIEIETTLDKYKYYNLIGSYVWFISIDDYYGGLECASYGKVVGVAYNPEDDMPEMPWTLSIEVENGNIYETDYTNTFDSAYAFHGALISFNDIYMSSAKKLNDIFWKSMGIEEP